MPHIAVFLISLALLFILVKKERIIQLLLGGIIGGALAFIVDYFGGMFGFYRYARMTLPILGKVPIFHVLSLVAITIMYLNWLPREWHRKLGYTAFMSGIFLIPEAVMYQVGALEYMNWQFWYSYILDIIGLSIVGYLSEKATIRPKPV